ncbi:MAG: hypothetical protein ACK5Q5_01850 [Planctomycetaceae bacterium]
MIRTLKPREAKRINIDRVRYTSTCNRPLLQQVIVATRYASSGNST